MKSLLDTAGSFICQCNLGFMLSEHDCFPEETCLKLGCHENADCIEVDSETADSEYGCQCKTGFVGDGKIACNDINECDATLSTCGQNGRCINTDGSFECGCEKGYEHIPDRCVDVDECKIGGHVCDINAYCYNVPGKNFFQIHLGLQYQLGCGTSKWINFLINNKCFSRIVRLWTM